MQMRYVLGGEQRAFAISDSDDLAELCAEAEGYLRREHPELADREYLTEQVADALLNSLAVDDEEVDLGQLA